MSLRDDLINEIRESRAVLVAGSGLSAATSGNSPVATWSGLIESGVQRVCELHPNVSPSWIETVEMELNLATTTGNVSGYLAAAQHIVRELHPGELREWMSETVGGLPIVTRSAIEALDRLTLPILTTNYDTLIERVTDRQSVVWNDPNAVLKAIRSASPSVIHLHGIWNDPDSIIFSPESYGVHLAAQSIQALQRSIAILECLIFVGFGAGVNDPNFSALTTWMGQTFSEGGPRHYRLCVADDSTDVDHNGMRIYSVPYGSTFADFSPFVEALAEDRQATSIPGAALNAARQVALSASYMDERVRNEAVLGEHIEDLDSRTIDDLLVPPVLLPVPYPQYLAAQGSDDEERPSRCNSTEEAGRNGVTIICAPEKMGLTASLEWLVVHAARSAETPAAPVLVDYRKIGPGKLPLEKLIRSELLSAGSLAEPNTRLPAYVLAVDNIQLSNQKRAARFRTELLNPLCRGAFLGCREGYEQELAAYLADAEIEATVRYLGKFHESDVKRMVALVDLDRVATLSDEVIRIALSEHLVRSPQNVGLLISVLLQGEAFMGTASETALLDAYVSLLLGRGDASEDSRVMLDAMGRSDIVSAIAAELVERHIGSINHSDAVAVLEDYFETVGWWEPPLDVLRNLIDRHILVERGNQLQFTQTSFLHLFAAKRMESDPDFREMVLRSPLPHARIVTHYVALTRSDGKALERVHSLFGEAIFHVDGGADVFSKTTTTGVELKSVDDLLTLMMGPDEGDTSSEDDVDEDESESEDVDWALVVSENDLLPYPGDDIESANPALRIAMYASLLSSVLRDSELVRNKQLKRQVLIDTLGLWASLVAAVEKDERFIEFGTQLARDVSDELGIDGGRRDDYIKRVIRDAPLFYVLGGVMSTLASKKLSKILDECFLDEGFMGTAGTAVLGAFVEIEIEDQGWSRHLPEVGLRFGNVPAVYDVLTWLTEQRCDDVGTGQDVEIADDFLVEQYLSKVAVVNDQHRKVAKDKIRWQLRDRRRKRRARKGSIDVDATLEG